MSHGFLYLAVGADFVAEARRSAYSVREHHSDVPIAIATDSEDYDLETFDEIILLEETDQFTVDGRTWLYDTVLDPDLSPFDKTIYLDTDTYVCDDLGELFELLDDYDLAVARVPEQPVVETLPEQWNEFNTGVIAYRDSTAIRDLLRKWGQIYHARIEVQDQAVDQPSFAEALYTSDVRWFTLPQRYNVRYPRSGMIAHDPKIVHGRANVGSKQIAGELNSVSGPRLYQPKSTSTEATLWVRQTGPAGWLEDISYRIGSLIRGFKFTLNNEGIGSAIKKSVFFVLEKIR